MNWLKEHISKKLFVAVFAFLIVVADAKYGLGLDMPSRLGLLGLAVAYILGQSQVDKNLLK